MKVLIVDDEEFNRDLVAQLLNLRFGSRVETLEAVDGVEAVEMTRRERPNLILMDLSLPRKSGWDAVREIKADAALAHIPIIALTAHAMAGDREQALAVGCNDYLSKPFLSSHFLETVARWLQL